MFQTTKVFIFAAVTFSWFMAPATTLADGELRNKNYCDLFDDKVKRCNHLKDVIADEEAACNAMDRSIKDCENSSAICLASFDTTNETYEEDKEAYEKYLENPQDFLNRNAGNAPKIPVPAYTVSSDNKCGLQDTYDQVVKHKKAAQKEFDELNEQLGKEQKELNKSVQETTARVNQDNALIQQKEVAIQNSSAQLQSQMAKNNNDAADRLSEDVQRIQQNNIKASALRSGSALTDAQSVYLNAVTEARASCQRYMMSHKINSTLNLNSLVSLGAQVQGSNQQSQNVFGNSGVVTNNFCPSFQPYLDAISTAYRRFQQKLQENVEAAQALESQNQRLEADEISAMNLKGIANQKAAADTANFIASNRSEIAALQQDINSAQEGLKSSKNIFDEQTERIPIALAGLKVKLLEYGGELKALQSEQAKQNLPPLQSNPDDDSKNQAAIVKGQSASKEMHDLECDQVYEAAKNACLVPASISVKPVPDASPTPPKSGDTSGH